MKKKDTKHNIELSYVKVNYHLDKSLMVVNFRLDSFRKLSLEIVTPFCSIYALPQFHLNEQLGLSKSNKCILKINFDSSD